MTCPHKPEEDPPVSIGVYNCPVCGVRVISGMPHPETEEEND